jgi:DNA-binding NarL/FixJ family response regulator
MNSEIRVAIADDHPLMLKAVRHSLEAEQGIAVVGEARDGRAALALIREQRPEIVVLDIGMPGLNGFAVLREAKAMALRIETVFLTAQSEASLFEEAMALGAKGYVLKECVSSDIVTGVRAAADGRHYISPALSGYLMKRAAPEGPKRGLGELTSAERVIVKLIGEYKTTREIAEQLFISPLTAETHRRNICEKLRLRGSNALIKFALAHKTDVG